MIPSAASVLPLVVLAWAAHNIGGASLIRATNQLGIPESFVREDDADRDAAFEHDIIHVSRRDDENVRHHSGRELEDTTTSVVKFPAPLPVNATVKEVEYGEPKQTTTTFVGGNGAHGAMFSITTHKRLLVQSLDFHTDRTGPIEVRVCGKRGDYVGYETMASEWTHLADTEVRGAGKGIPTVIPTSEFTPVAIDADETFSFYVTLRTEDLRYTNYEHLEVGYTLTRTPAFDFHVGTGVSGYVEEGRERHPKFDPRNTMFPRRVFNGVIHYRLAKTDEGGGTMDDSILPTDRFVTTLEGGSTGNGAMFDVVAETRIQIHGIDVHLATKERTRVEVWTKEGSHVGHEQDRTAWDIMLAEEFVYGEGVGWPTPIPATFDGLYMERGQIRSFYVTAQSTSMSYTPVEEPVGSEYKSNDDLRFLVGTGVAYPFNKTYTPRVFNGVIRYTSPSRAPTTSPSPTPVPTARPTGTPLFTQQRIRLWGASVGRLLLREREMQVVEEGGGEEVELVVTEDSFVFFENVTRRFLQENSGLAGVTITNVSVSRDLAMEDVSHGARPEDDSDGQVLDMYTNITGEYEPPPHVNFGKLVEDDFEERGDVFVRQLNEDPAFEEISEVRATEVVFPLVQVPSPSDDDRSRQSDRLGINTLLIIVYACSAAVVLLLLVSTILVIIVRRQRQRQKPVTTDTNSRGGSSKLIEEDEEVESSSVGSPSIYSGSSTTSSLMRRQTPLPDQ